MSWLLDFPSRALECLGVRLILPPELPRDSDELLHCRVPGTKSSSMSSMSSDMMKCWGVALPPTKPGSRFRAEAREGRPGLLTMVKPVRISICCQRCSLSRRAAVTSPSACLWTDGGGKRSFSTLYYVNVFVGNPIDRNMLAPICRLVWEAI